MKLLYCDETSVEPSQGPFFIYGGLAVPSDKAGALTRAFTDLLAERGYDPMKDPADPRPLKFNCKPPEGVDQQTMNALKENSVALAVELGCQLFVNVIPHDIALKTQKRHWPLNHLLWCLEVRLEQDDDDALVIVDHYEKGEARTLRSIMQERFLRGLRFPGGRYPLRNVLGFAEGYIGTSHFASILDVALGCIRYTINKRGSDDERRIGRKLAQQVEPLLPKDERGSVLITHLSFLPGKVVRPMLGQYRVIAAYLKSCGLAPAKLPDVKDED